MHMPAARLRSIGLTVALSALVGCGGSAPAPVTSSSSPQGAIDRTVLPIAEPPRPTYTELDARNVKAPPGSR